MSTAWRTVRVFISSTFRDMHAERDHLVNVVFPALRERLEKHRIHLIDIDLRWGLTREDTINQKTLLLCLDSIHECRPFFLGILGDLYGSRSSAVTPETIAKHPWLSDAIGKSYTELEILYRLVQLGSLADRAFFCFRSPKVYDTVPEPKRGTFIVDPQYREMQEALKQRIRDHFGSGQRKRRLYDGYPARWDPNAFDRPSNSKGRISGLDAFGKWIFKRLWDAIKAEHNLPDTSTAETALDPLAEEQEYHDRFMESRLRVYVGREQINCDMFAFAEGNEPAPCLVTGSSGSGKSAAMARFVVEYSNRHQQEIKDGKLLVIPHFIGASPRSTNLRDMLRRFCQIFKARFGFAEDVPEEAAKLSVTFREFVNKVPADARVLLVIDALNQLDEADRAQELFWLPAALPPQVKVIVSCITDPGKTEPVLEAFSRRKHRPVQVAALSATEQREIIRQVPSLSAKTLDDDQVRLLLSNPATANPLFLLVALEELRGFAPYERLNERIAAFPREGDTVTTIFTQVIERLTEEFDQEVVETVLTLLASARRGLSERELQELVAGLAGAGDLFPVLRQLRPYLLSRAGLIDFYHRSLWKAVRVKYLAGASTRHASHGYLADYFRLKTDPALNNSWSGNHSRGFRELPYHLFEAQRVKDSYALARDETFHATQRSTFPSEADLPCQTIRFALQGAMENDDAIEMTEFALAHVRWLNEIANESPLQALRAGSLQRAWELADFYEIERTALWYLLLAWELTETNRGAEAEQTLQRLRQKSLPRLSERQVRCTVSLLSNLLPHCKLELLPVQQGLLDDKKKRELCERLQERQCFAIARIVSDGIRDQGERALALQAITVGQARAGEDAAALETAMCIDYGDKQADALSQIAVAQAQARKFDAALATMAKITDKWHRRVGFTDIAVAQAQAGHNQEAAASFAAAVNAVKDGIKDGTLGWLNVEQLCKIAEAQARSGDQDAASVTLVAALDIARSTRQGFGSSFGFLSDHDTALKYVATALAQTGKVAAALDVANQIEDAQCCSETLGVIGIAQAQTGRREATARTFAHALTITKRIDDPARRARALAEVAASHALAGDTPAARRTFRAADAAAQDAVEDREDVIWSIARAHLRAGDLNAASTMARSIAQPDTETSHSHYELLKEIAVAQIRAGEHAAAFDTAGSITSKWYGGWTLEAIAIALAQAGDLATALDTACRIEDGVPRASALEGVAGAQARAGNARDAATTYAASLATDTYKHTRISIVAETLTEIAEAQAKAGNRYAAADTFAAARRMIDRIEESETRDWRLKWLAASQARAGDLMRALATAQECPRSREFAIQTSIRRHAEASDRETLRATWSVALAVAQSLPEGDSREGTLKAISSAHARTESFDTALLTAREIKDQLYRSIALMEIAVAKSRGGDLKATRGIFSDAIAAAERCAFCDQRFEAIAIAQAKIGIVRDALETANRINDLRFRLPAMREIAVAQAQGDRPAALQALTAIYESAIQASNDDSGRDSALQNHALALARVGEFAAACDGAQNIKESYWRAKALTEIAATQSQAGGRETATGLLALAFQVAESVLNEDSRACCLREIALAQVQIGDTIGASRTFQVSVTIASQAGLRNRLEEIAVAQAEAGFGQEAVDTARLIADQQEDRLPKVAAALAATKQTECFKRLVIPCAYYAEASLKICALLARLYPRHATSIAEAVMSGA